MCILCVSMCSLGSGGRYNCLITLCRVLSPQLMRQCSTLIHYDADDDDISGGGFDDVVSQYQLNCILLRSSISVTQTTGGDTQHCGQ